MGGKCFSRVRRLHLAAIAGRSCVDGRQEGASLNAFGEDRTCQVSVRVIAATNRNLEQEVEAGRFRRDLYFRLTVFPLKVPPLRDRLEDISILAASFLEQTAKRMHSATPVLTRQNVDDQNALGSRPPIHSCVKSSAPPEIQRACSRARLGSDVTPWPQIAQVSARKDRQSASQCRAPPGE